MSEKRYALLVGNGTFPNEPKLHPLRCPLSDVEGMRRVLGDPARGAFDTITALCDRPSHEIRLRIHETLLGATREDVVLIYYSGHGKPNLNGALHLTTVDTSLKLLGATAVPVAAIRDSINESSCRRILLVLDCCFSGAAGQAFLKGGIEDQLQTVARGSGIFMISASTADATAEEKESDRFSLFTKHLIDGLERGVADQDGDGLVTADELYNHVRRAVLEERHAQEPTKFALDVQGDLVVARSGREPRRERAGKIRQLLLDLAREDRISDELLAEASRIIRTPAASLDITDRQRDALLERLHTKELRTGEFVEHWLRLAPRVPPLPPVIQTPSPVGGAVTSDVAAEISPPPRVTPTDSHRPSAESGRDDRGATPTASPPPRRRSRRRLWLTLAAGTVIVGALAWILPRISGPRSRGYVAPPPAAATSAREEVVKPTLTDFRDDPKNTHVGTAYNSVDTEASPVDRFAPSGAWVMRFSNNDSVILSFNPDRTLLVTSTTQPIQSFRGTWDLDSSSGEVVLNLAKEVVSLYDARPDKVGFQATWHSHSDQSRETVQLEFLRDAVNASGALDARRVIESMGK